MSRGQRKTLATGGKQVSGQDVFSSGAADRYARALFALAQDADIVDVVESELASLKAILLAHPALAGALESPVISAAEKAAVITQITKKAGLGALTHSFVGAAAQARRAGELSHMADRFAALSAARHGIVQAHAVTAQPMSARQQKDLAAALKKASGQEVKITTRVDPALLGGLIVKVGSRMFDSSLKSRLEGLNLAMKES